VKGAKSATTDIYFMQVRPYSQEYRQAQQGGGGGGGQQQDQPGRLSQQQRDIIAGTFNALRDSAITLRRDFDENAATLRLAQQRVKEDAGQLASRLVDRGITSSDSNFAKIEQILRVASAAMDTSEQLLAGSRLREALAPEQRALQQLQRAEAVFREVRVSMGEQGGGGGGGGASDAEDLADLFELQRERMRNQYETVQRGNSEEQQASQQVDATAEKLKQLAARQQQQNERARRKADSLSLGASGSGSGDAQRQLAQEAEQAARQLERLAREQQSQSLADAARRLNESADAMRRAAASGNSQQGTASSAAAMDRLREASRLLEQERNGRAQRAAEDAVQAGRRLAEQQRQVAEDVGREAGASPQDLENLQRRIAQRKGAMADSVRALAGRLNRAVLESERQQPEVARQLEEAADTMQARRIEDKLRYTQNALRGMSPEQQQRAEGVIGADIEQMNRALEEARAAAASGKGSQQSRMAAAADRARDLVRGMESLEERMRQQQEQSGQQPGGQQPGGQQPGGQPRGNQQGAGGQPGASSSMGGQQRSIGAPGGGGQFTRELRQRLDDARALRRELNGREDVDLTQLDRAIQGMERMGSGVGGGSLDDPRATRELRGQVLDGLRSFEYSLGVTLRGKADRVLVDRAGDVPPEYRKYVEEYYRSLARTKPR